MSNETQLPDMNKALSAWLTKQHEAMKKGTALEQVSSSADIALELHEFIRARGFNAHPRSLTEGLFIAMQLVGGIHHAAQVAGQFSRESRA